MPIIRINSTDHFENQTTAIVSPHTHAHTNAYTKIQFNAYNIQTKRIESNGTFYWNRDQIKMLRICPSLANDSSRNGGAPNLSIIVGVVNNLHILTICITIKSDLIFDETEKRPNCVLQSIHFFKIDVCTNAKNSLVNWQKEKKNTSWNHSTNCQCVSMYATMMGSSFKLLSFVLNPIFRFYDKQNQERVGSSQFHIIFWWKASYRR